MEDQTKGQRSEDTPKDDVHDDEAAKTHAEASEDEHIMNKEEMRAHAEKETQAEKEAQAAPAAPPPPPAAAPTLSPDQEPPREMADFLKPPVVTRDVVDEASKESFPASDPPGYTSASASPEKVPDEDA